MARVTHAYTEDELRLQRCARRLRDELGVNAAGVEVIVHMRRQLLEMLSQLAELEAQLSQQRLRRGARLARYRELYIDALYDELGE